MSTVKIFGGSLNQYGNRLNLGLTGSESFINNSAEVEMPPVWENKHSTANIIGYNYGFPPSHLEADPTNKIYHPGAANIFSANGIITTTNESIGHDLRLAANAFVSCSDGNNNETITLTLRSSSLLSGSNNIQEITPSDISVIFPNNSDAASDQPIAKFFIQTSSNFEIFENHEFKFVVRAEDSTNKRAVQNHLVASSDQPPVDVEYKIFITNLGTAPFIITQSEDVSISSSTSTEDNIPEMTFHLGNEGSPDFSLIKDIYIKDRDRTGPYDSGIFDINTIKTYGDAALALPNNDVFFNAGIGGYVVNTGSLPNIFQISSSNLTASAADKDNRYFKLRFNEDLLPRQLTADNSPYIFSISASDFADGTYGVAAKSSSCKITLTLDNEDPVWYGGDGAFIQTSQKEITTDLISHIFQSASDPGGGSVNIELLNDTVNYTYGELNDYLPAFDFLAVNTGTTTGSFTFNTSDTFPIYPTTLLSENENITFTVKASDGFSPRGTANQNITIRLDAPPSFNGATGGHNEKIVTVTEDLAGNINQSYPSAFDSIQGGFGGTCNLDTGSGFVITSDDSRVQANWFRFTGTDATLGNDATFTIETSSLFRRVDADVTASLVVTASDTHNQEVSCSVEIRITNEDDYPDIFPSFSNLQFLIAPDIDGETTLGNTVNFSSTIQAVPAIGGGFEGQILSIVGSKKLVFANSTFADITDTFTTANGTSGLSIKAVTTDGDIDNTPRYDSNTMSTGPGTIIWWWKIVDNSSTDTKRIFGNDNAFELRISSTDVITVDMPSADGSISNYAGSDGGDFHMLTLTFDGTSGTTNTAKFYLNKTLKNTSTGFGSSTVNTKITEAGSIGGRLDLVNANNTVHLHPVTMSMMAYYDAELNQEDITQIFHAFSASHGLS